MGLLDVLAQILQLNQLVRLILRKFLFEHGADHLDELLQVLRVPLTICINRVCQGDGLLHNFLPEAASLPISLLLSV